MYAQLTHNGDITVSEEPQEGFKLLIEASHNIDYDNTIEYLFATYDETVEAIIQHYEVRKSKCLILRQIDTLKKDLANSDYKVIVNAELAQMGLSPKYDVERLHPEREEIRNKINVLETLLTTVGETI